MSQSSIPNTFKITNVKSGENRRFPASASFADLKLSLSTFWGEHAFVLTYQDEDGDVITVSTEVEFAEALSVAKDMSCKVLKFNAYRNDEELRASLKKPVSHQPHQPSLPQAVHHGVECDRSGMNPIIGPRYHVPGADYDLCAAEFEKLPETERVLFVKMDHPRRHAVPCGGRFGVKHPGMSCPRGRCPRMTPPPPPLGMFNMPPSLSVDDLILQASIAASLFDGHGDQHASPFHTGAGAGNHEFSNILSSFMDAAAVAAVNAATNQRKCHTPSTENTEHDEKANRSDNPLADLLSGIRNMRNTSLPTAGACGGGGGGECPMKNEEIRSQCQEKMRKHFQKMREECKSGGGHPLAHLFSVLDLAANAANHTQAGGGGGGGGGDSPLPIHHGVECDKSGMNPIVGPRYTILGANFDLCSAEFEKLPEVERMLYHKISTPGSKPLPCHEAKQPTATNVDDINGTNTKHVEPKKSAIDNTKEATAAEEPDEKPKPELLKKDSKKDSVEKNDSAKAASSEATPETSNEGGDLKFEKELLELAKMGFVDHDTNLALLKRYQGRVGRVVNFILEL